MIADLQRQLGIDGTLGTQFIIFILIFVWLKYVFFNPFFKIIEERQHKTQGLKKEAEELQIEADRKEAELALKMSDAKKQISADREKVLSKARAEAAVVINDARKDAKSLIEESRKAAQKDSEQALKDLSGSVKAVAGMLVEKLTKERVKL
jgi:F0F1-type ATP synthase membrane subunit b/b'